MPPAAPRNHENAPAAQLFSKQKDGINQFLRFAPVDQIRAEQLHIVLDRRCKLIVTGRACRGNRGQHGPVVL